MSTTLIATRETAPCETRNAQAMRALSLANRKRVEKANVKRDLRDGTLTLAEVAEQRPEPLRPMPLFALVLELPGFGPGRLDRLGRRAVAAGINLARTVGDASNHTLDWLVRTVNGLDEPEPAATTATTAGTTPVPAAVEEADTAGRRRLLREIVGSYHARGETRRVVLTASAEAPLLLDRGSHDERVIECFDTAPGLLEVAAVAAGYLDEARRLGRPVVAAPALPFVGEAQEG